MKPLFFQILAQITITLMGILSPCLQAQGLTEALQKHIWASAETQLLPDLESLLPASECDTLFYLESSTYVESSMQVKASIAEVVEMDSLGRPSTVILFESQLGRMTPITKSQTTFDATGRLTELESWSWKQDDWTPEAVTIHRLDAFGNDHSLEILLWENGDWKRHYFQMLQLVQSDPFCQP